MEEPDTSQLADRRRGPFLILVVAALAICVIVIAIPDPVLSRLERNRPLTDPQAGWAYRLLVFFALAQIVYTGMAVFRIDRVEQLRAIDERFAGLAKPAVISSLARNGAVLVLFTLIYGIASLLLTAQRGGFWLFPVLALAQGAWYYREIGQIAQWERLQPQEESKKQGTAWSLGGPDYCPPIARGLTPLPVTSGVSDPRGPTEPGPA